MSLSNDGIKILAFFIILISGIAGAAAPSIAKHFASKTKSIKPATFRVISKFLTSLSAGIVLTTSLVHVGADAVVLTQETGGIFADPTFQYLTRAPSDILNNNKTNTTADFVDAYHGDHSHPYPYVNAFIVFTVFVSFFLSSEISAWGMHKMKELKKMFLKNQSKKNAARIEDNNNNTNEPVSVVDQRQTDDQEEETEKVDEDESVELSVEDRDRFAHRVQLNTIIAGVAVHSFILGITLGISRDKSTSRTLTAVLSLDCLFDGTAVGNLILLSETSFLISCVYVLTFAFMAPVGVGVGLGIAGNENIRAQGIMSAVSAGLLLHMAFELFHQIFEHHHCHDMNHEDDDKAEKRISNNADDDNNDETEMKEKKSPSSSSSATSSSTIDDEEDLEKSTSAAVDVADDSKNKEQDEDDDDDSDFAFMESLLFRVLCYLFILAGSGLQMAIRVWE